MMPSKAGSAWNFERKELMHGGRFTHNSYSEGLYHAALLYKRLSSYILAKLAPELARSSWLTSVNRL